MSHFYGTMEGRRGGERTATDPVHVTLNGWNCGVTIRAAVVDGRDVFAVYATGGSNHVVSPVQVGVVMDSQDGPFFVAGDGS